MENNKLHQSFFKMASFTLLFLSITIFFGSIFLTAYYLDPQIKTYQQAITSTDIINKAFLTSIFVLQFAVVMSINHLIKLLEEIKKKMLEE